MRGSYQLESFTENRVAEVTRLHSQVDLFFEKEYEMYLKFGLREGMKILDCGSGPGYLLRNLLNKMPGCDATALEIDPFLFSVLTENSISGDKQLYRPVNASIYETGFAANSFDFVITRLVIEHLEEPLRALYEVNRILRPGGKLVIVSNDFAYHLLTYPVIPQLDEMYNAYCRSRSSEGGNPFIGRILPVFLENSNFEKINLEIITAHSRLLGDETFLKAENVNISKSLVEAGFLSRNTLAELVEKWFEMVKDPYHVFYRQLFVVSGEKSREDSPHIYSQRVEKDLKRTLNPELVDEPKMRLDIQRGKFKNLINKYQESPRVKGLIQFAESQNATTQKSDDDSQKFLSPISKTRDLNEIENILQTVWKAILKNNSLAIDDNYFDIGGDSVLIPEIVARLSNEYSIQLRILDIFDYPSIRQLADYIHKNHL